MLAGIRSQTGKYVVRAEDLQRANNLPCAQRPIKRAKFGKYTCQAFRHLQKVPLHMRRRCEGGFSKHANLRGKSIFGAQKTNFPVWIRRWEPCLQRKVKSAFDESGCSLNAILAKRIV